MLYSTAVFAQLCFSVIFLFRLNSTHWCLISMVIQDHVEQVSAAATAATSKAKLHEADNGMYAPPGFVQTKALLASCMLSCTKLT